jgi:hypothetical protein
MKVIARSNIDGFMRIAAPPSRELCIAWLIVESGSELDCAEQEPESMIFDGQEDLYVSFIHKHMRIWVPISEVTRLDVN